MRAQHECGARRRVLTAKFRSAPCLPFDQGKTLSPGTHLRQPNIFRGSHAQPAASRDGPTTAAARPRQIYADSDSHPHSVHKAVHNRVGNGRVADVFVPVLDRELAGRPEQTKRLEFDSETVRNLGGGLSPGLG